MSYIFSALKVEIHANSKYENPLKLSETNSMCWLKVNISNNDKINTLQCWIFLKMPFNF